MVRHKKYISRLSAIFFLIFLFGCGDRPSYGDRFRTMKTECKRLAQMLDAEYEVEEANGYSDSHQPFTCSIIDKRVGSQYWLESGVENVIGAQRGIYIHKQFKTNVAFQTCYLKALPGATLGGDKYSLKQKSNTLDMCNKKLRRD